MLALEVEYLSGVAYAADFRDRSRAEWPPHPARLFSALVAATYEAALGESALAVLRWLELQGAPSIHCSEATRRSTPLVYVPVNDPDLARLLPESRLRQARTFPGAVPQDPRVTFIWPQAEADDPQRQALARIAENLTYLGSSRSLVRAALCDAPPPPTLAPSDAGELVLRVPGPGRLDELDALYDLDRRPTPGLLQPYARMQEETRPPAASTGPFGDFLAFRRTAGPALPLEAALTLTEAVRNAVLSLAGDDAPAVLHGHDQGAHCAWVPLPFVGSTHADGRLLGFAALLPRGIPAQARQAVLRTLARLEQVNLPGGRGWRVEPVGEDRRTSLWARTWARKSRVWASTTPVVLDRYPRPGRAGRSIEAILAQSCERAGYAVPAAVEVSPFSPLAGVPPSRRFRTRRRAEDPRRPHTHVTLRFERPVAGPVLIGAGRYFGLGLFRPVTDSTSG